MREMKDSGIEWIGEIPADWTTTRIGNFFHFSSGDSLTNEEIQDEGLYKVYGANGPRGYYHHTNLTGKHILIGRVGALCGNIHIVNEPIWVTEHALIAEQISPGVYTDFAARVFESMNLGQYSKASAQPVIASSVVQRLQIPIPPSLEQRHIAKYLDRKCSQIDAIIARQQEVIEKLKAYKLSVITEAVTKGLNPNVPMKDSGVEWIGEIPEHWETASISRVATVVRGASPRPAGDPRYFNGHDIPWITVAEVTKDDGKYITSTESFLTEEGAKYSRLVEKGTLLLSNSGATLGVPKVTLITGCINDGSVAFFDLKVEQMYLLYIFKSRTLELRKQMQGYGQPNLNTTIIKSIAIPLPHPDEQKSICEYLDKRCKAVDDTIKIKEKVVDRLAEYKKSLIYEVVTGKKEV